MNPADDAPPPLSGPAGPADLLEEVAGAGLWRLQVRDGRLQGSPRLALLLGTPGGQVPPDFRFIAPPWRGEIESLVRRCAVQGLPFDHEVQLLDAQGRRAWARVMGLAGRDAAGQVAQVDGVVQVIEPHGAFAGALLTVDAQARLNYVNPSAERLLGRPFGSLQGRPLWDLFPRTARMRVESQARSALARRQPLELEEADAAQRQWLELRGQPFGDGLAVHLRDVTARHHAQEQLRLLEGSIARLNDIVIITEAGPFDEPGPAIVFVNEAFERRTGYSRAEVIGRSPRLLQGPQTQRDRLDRVRAALRQWEPVRVDLINYRKDGRPFWVDLDISPVWDPARRLTHWVAVGRDVTERKAAEEKIRYLAFYDALTGLPNRQLLLDRLHEALAMPATPGGGALMFIDLDNFKVLNDTMGHQKGDLLLQLVAQRLRACVGEDDTVARLGGDEFVILLRPRPAGERPMAVAAAAVAERALAALGEPYPLGGYLHHSSCSIGVTLFGHEAAAVSELLKQADLAMYQAKRTGRNTVCFFDPQLQAQASASAALAADLRQAWREQQFVLDYQPQVDGRGRVTCVEALIRWIHPERGRVPPDAFIASAEESSMILAIGRWVLEAACAQLAAWARRPERAGLAIAVNVSARQFRHPQFADTVAEAIGRAGIAPHRLKLELTESLMVDGFDDTVAKMARLKTLGVGLALDDFGMGYSSLAYLKRLPLDQLKFDREFVKDVLTDANDAAIARTIVALAHSLSLDVVAEGVETQAQRDFLAGVGCDRFQGFLYCAPLGADALEAFLRAASPVSAAPPSAATAPATVATAARCGPG